MAPGNVEVCNLLDGSIEEGAQVPLYVDADRDGDGDASAASMLGCAGTAGTSTTNASTPTACGDPETKRMEAHGVTGPMNEANEGS